jgi:hypothetical protein
MAPVTRRHLGIIVVNLLVLVVFAEVVALVAYYLDTGALFYTHRKSYPPVLEIAEQRLTADALHPYFGPTHREGHPFEIPAPLQGAGAVNGATNNFGFVSPHRYPFQKSSANQFMIGIFGGSVGVWFCQVGADRMTADLRQRGVFPGRELVPLCFAHEGYKQPQQLLVLSYFLSIGQPFDLVVNIDGVNEVALSAMNEARGMDISMPSPMHMAPLVNVIDRSTLTPEKLYLLADINRDKERMNSLVARMGRNRIASVNFVLERLYQRTRHRYPSKLGRFANLPSNPPKASVVKVTPPVEPRDEAALFDDIAKEWAATSMLMHDMLAARDIPYVHVLQPNQYYTQRRFSEAEARVAKNDQSPFKASVEKGYPALLRASGELQKKVRFLNGVGIFDGEPSAVYMDDCCHYTLAGNRRLADFIAAGIAAARN